MELIRTKHWIVVAAAVTALTLGSSMPGAAASSTPSATKKFCDLFKSNATLVQQVFLASQTGAAPSVLQAKLTAGLAAARASAPAAIASDYDVVTSDEQADFAAITSAEKSIDTWVLAHCKFNVVKVTADDTAVTTPKTVKPGFVAFDVTNSGSAARYYGVLPLSAGQTVAQLVATPLDQLRPNVITQVLTTPGQEAVAYGPITKPGVYVVLDANSAGTPQASYTTFTVKK